MITRQQAWDFVRKAKKDLNKETDPDKRHKIAIWGLEMQELALNLGDSNEPEYKRCKKCGLEKHKDEFTIVKGTRIHIKKNGERREYFSVARRHNCNSCTWPWNFKTGKKRKDKLTGY